MKTSTSEHKIDKPLIQSENLFPVVGIGASAGGLAAFEKLLQAIPENSGIAYVLVQHLDPSHDSLLPELLQKATALPVIEITDDIKVEPNHIYIMPSNKMLIANDDVLELSPRPLVKNHLNLPINLFFSSLAEVHQSHAIGVVLSGTASDGTLGLQSIKERGGITFAQDEASADYEAMPQNAVLAGVVDFIIPPEKIPGKILAIIHSYTQIESKKLNPDHQDDHLFNQMVDIVQTSQGADFSWHQPSVIRGRIHRRMAVTEQATPLTYLNFLATNTAEQQSLYNDLLIRESSFFRDAAVLDYLRNIAFPALLKTIPPKEPLRIWVPGCSTGAEAFSIAMCLDEFLATILRTGSRNAGSENKDFQKVRIVATDTNETAIAKARTGIYTKSELAGLSSERVKQFFTKTMGGYQANKSIREICIFARHDLVKDMPFAKMDLICCRDIMTYLQPSQQERALSAFHYALNSTGFLLLGKSDNYPTSSDLFAANDVYDKLFTRNQVPSNYNFKPILAGKTDTAEPGTFQGKPDLRINLKKAADDLILSQYVPAGIVVNEAMDIVHLRGRTANYLEQVPGKPSHRFMSTVKEGLAFELRSILHKVKKENTTAIKENIPLLINETLHQVTIEAIPLPNVTDPHYLVLFHAIPPTIQKQKKSNHKELEATTILIEESDHRIKQLENELAQTTKEMLQAIANQEAANQELQSSNEELTSGSEELQGLNEELETSKKELQSTNEEISAVNLELNSLNRKLTSARNYTESIIATVRVPLLVLDNNFRIKTANRSFYKTFMVNEHETEGVLIYGLGNKQWDIPKLHTLLEEILPLNIKFTDYEVSHNFPEIGERVMLLNASEIIRDEEEEKLILLSIQDITEKAQAHLKEMEFQKQLELKVEQRTIELNEANESLLQKNKELEILNTELASFSYISSHDLQEPLRKIKTFANLLLEKESKTLSKNGMDYLNRMQNAAKRMQALIEDLLAYSHTNTKDRKFEITSLEKIVADVKTELSESIDEKKAVIETGKLGVANINPFQFRQLFNNLISNSLKFTFPGKAPHIVIKSEITTAEKCGNELLTPGMAYRHITFSDNGIGFSPEYELRIFEIFQRLNGKEEYPGTGVGLAIVKKIVGNHQGIITATGELNKGAIFDIYIPA